MAKIITANNNGTPPASINNVYFIAAVRRSGPIPQRLIKKKMGGKVSSQNKKNRIVSNAKKTPIVTPSNASNNAKWRRCWCCTEFQEAIIAITVSRADMGKNNTDMPSIPIKYSMFKFGIQA